ncbi:hypothetical protein [Saccharothrix xinjiangensis]|uniref:Lipoprotein n=1 Tax=Saccharothrix xinjiangensis TaxID=204798 RepID=A0ABV9Y1W3_9PSEU
MQYKVTLTPPKPVLTVTVAVAPDSAQKFSAKVTALDLTKADLQPDGNPIDKALAAAAKPLVQALVDKVPPIIVDAVKDKSVSFDLDQPIGYKVTAGDVPITLTATNLVLGTHEGHLLVTGGIEVAP